MIKKFYNWLMQVNKSRKQEDFSFSSDTRESKYMASSLIDFGGSSWVAPRGGMDIYTPPFLRSVFILTKLMYKGCVYLLAINVSLFHPKLSKFV